MLPLGMVVNSSKITLGSNPQVTSLAESDFPLDFILERDRLPIA